MCVEHLPVTSLNSTILQMVGWHIYSPNQRLTRCWQEGYHRMSQWLAPQLAKSRCVTDFWTPSAPPIDLVLCTWVPTNWYVISKNKDALAQFLPNTIERLGVCHTERSSCRPPSSWAPTDHLDADKYLEVLIIWMPINIWMSWSSGCLWIFGCLDHLDVDGYLDVLIIWMLIDIWMSWSVDHLYVDEYLDVLIIWMASKISLGSKLSTNIHFDNYTYILTIMLVLMSIITITNNSLGPFSIHM